ncbi:MAG: hypothetical protein ABIB79_00755 [archaeon]
MKKSNIITILIILWVVTLSIIILKSSPTSVDEKIVKCIGENSVLYVQLGCHACEVQEELFGDNYQYLNVVDCFYDRNKCSEISATPTWIINGETYKGVQSIDELKNITGCQIEQNG